MEFPRLRSEFRDWQNEMNAKVSDYVDGRQMSYPSIEEQLDLLFHDIEHGTLDTSGKFFKAIAAVKASITKPSWIEEYKNYDFSKETFEEDLD